MIRPSDRVYPYLTVLPMGFSWSVWFAQRACVHQVRLGPTLGSSTQLKESSERVLEKETGLVFYVYIDNIGIIGSDEKCVNAALEETVEILNLQGLLCHETSRASEVSESLGIEFNSKLICFRPTSKRYWKLRRTLEWCLGRENLTGRALEVILGHCTYFALLERSVLSVFASCYKYVKSNYWRSAPIWASVRAELLAFYGLMPMVVCDFSRGWSTSTVMYDSCPEGYGAVVAERSLVDVEALGRCRERSRFKKTSLGPRARALWDLDPDDPLSIRTPPPLADNVGENWVVEGDFPEVPLSFVRDSSWEVTLCDTWKYKMAVHFGRGSRCRVERRAGGDGT